MGWRLWLALRALTGGVDVPSLWSPPWVSSLGGGGQSLWSLVLCVPLLWCANVVNVNEAENYMGSKDQILTVAD